MQWHRWGFQCFWRWRPRLKGFGGPRIARELQALIRQMARENVWGAPRINYELLKLGFQVQERTVSRYQPKRPASGDKLKNWLAFLHNHRDGLVGMDFLAVPMATSRLLWIFVGLHHKRRRIAQFAVADHPQALWVVQQLREALPFDTAPQYAILDRDDKYGQNVLGTLQSMGVKPVRTAPRSPWQNPYVERFGGTLRRELLDKIIVFNSKQLHRVMREWIDYYHRDRSHLGLAKDAPESRGTTPQPSPSAYSIGSGQASRGQAWFCALTTALGRRTSLWVGGSISALGPRLRALGDDTGGISLARICPAHAGERIREKCITGSSKAITPPCTGKSPVRFLVLARLKQPTPER